MTETGTTEVAQITVSSRIPDFWEDQPRTWFIQAESVLYNQKLSDAAKYHLIVAKLGKNVVRQVSDVLLNPPTEGKYDHLKRTLLDIYEESETRKIQKLIGEMELGDQKPSQLLRRMRELARDKVNDSTLKIMWENLLPASVRAVLIVTDSKDLNTLASVADKVMETFRPVPIAAVDTPVNLATEIANINRRIDKMVATRSRPRYRGRGGNRGRSRSHQRSSRSQSTGLNTAKQDLCFYHARFGNKAHKCVQPCAWKEKPENAILCSEQRWPAA